MVKPVLPVALVLTVGLQLLGVSGASAEAPAHDHTDHDHAAHGHDHAAGRDDAPRTLTVPAADPARGVDPRGLVVATDGPCSGALEVADAHRPAAVCTHGPDEAPAEIGDVRTADMDPQEAAAVAAAAPPFACDGDGVSGRRAHAIYAVAPDRTDRYSSYLSTFKGIVAKVQDEYRQSSFAHGASDGLVYRFAHTTPVNGRCEPLVDHVRLPSSADDDSFGATISALDALGYNDPSRRYLVFVDAQLLCGIAQLYPDDRADPSANWNNRLSSAMFSRVDAGCWNYAETHELTHNIGGVQDSAPHSSGAGHCNDEHDVMCYADGGPTSSVFTACGSSTWERRLDCGGDDYFNPSPPPNTYLARHWNVANSAWLFTETGPPGGNDEEADPPAGGNQPPPARAPSLGISAPSAGLVNQSVRFSGSASDPDGDVSKVRVYRDGRLYATIGATGPWAITMSLSPGRHVLAAEAVDTGGRTSARRSVEVMALAPLPRDIRPVFGDDNRSQFEHDIARLAAQGVTQGCNPPRNTKFCPDKVVTRGMMAAFLVRALNLPPASGIDFVDDNGSIFEESIERLAAAGITRGCNPPRNDRFCPDAPVTRDQMAVFLVRALNLPPASGVAFTDDNGSVFEDAIERLAAAGITQGCNPPKNDKFCPKRAVTREVMAAFLTRALYR